MQESGVLAREDIQSRLKDPYQIRPEDVAEPPRSLFGILRRIGPGMILSASIVGSGELIATTTLGARVGYVLLWFIILSCLVKAAVQSELGRYVIATGQTGAEALNPVPGPRFLGVSWVLWAWVVMTVITFFQLGAMFWGVAQVLNQLAPRVAVSVWVLLLLGLTLGILLGGHYQRIEKLATIKVCLFTMLTLLCALLMTRQPQDFSWSRISEGFEFKLPMAGFALAVGAFGITGVGASELFMYPYWCVEKGYARFTGKREDSAAWRSRARGWIRVMNVDILASMAIYTIATIAFYLLGAGILHTRGLVPKKGEMISELSKMYTETLGGWAVWLFYIGAIATLYGTIFAATAGNCRAIADIALLAGKRDRGDYAARLRYRNYFIWCSLIAAVCLFFINEDPVAMVAAGGTAQTAMLPILSIGALYLRHRRLPRDVAPNRLATAALWTAACLIILASGAILAITAHSLIQPDPPVRAG